MNEPREGFWLAPPRKPRRQWFEVVAAVDLAMMASLLYVQFGLWPEKIWRICFAGGMTALLLLTIVLMPIVELVALRRTNRDRALADRVEGSEEYPVEIVVWVKGRRAGADRGLAYFDGPLLGFSGEKTSFLVAADDLNYPRGPMLSDWDLPFYPLKPKGTVEKTRVQLKPLVGFGWRFRRRLLSFLRTDESSVAERQWPPLRTFAEQERARLLPAPSPWGTTPDEEENDSASYPSAPDESMKRSELRCRGDEKGALLSDGLKNAVPLEDDVDRRALRVGKLD